MINIIVWSARNVQIESKFYELDSRDNTITFLKDLIDACEYGKETICLEYAEVSSEQGKAFYTEIERWHS